MSYRVKFYDQAGDPFRSFSCISLEFVHSGIKVIDKNFISHLVQYKDFSYFVFINKWGFYERCYYNFFAYSFWYLVSFVILFYIMKGVFLWNIIYVYLII